jgi:ribosome-binding factor A
MEKRRGERIRPERVAEQIRMDVAQILQNDMKDPRLALVTCTRVDLTRDLRYAKIFVSVLAEGSEQQQTLKALEGATGYVRRRLTERIGLRTSPEIRFIFDPSVEYGIRLDELIEKTKEQSPEDEDPADSGT